MRFTDSFPMIEEARATGRGHRFWLEIPKFILVFIVMSFVMQLICGLIEGFILRITQVDETTGMLIMLYEEIIGLVLVLLYCALAERRPLSSMGFVKKGAVIQYLKGIGIGFVLFSAVVLLGTLMGGFTFEGVYGHIQPGILLMFFVGFLFQGMFEEATDRGYFMVSLSRKNPVLAGVLVNSALFALSHGFNPGFGLFPAVNLLLFGLFASVYMLRTGNIWGVGAIHSVWNFVQGNFFGLSVSGMPLMPSVFVFGTTDNALISGGDFGPEGGLPVTIVLAVGIALVMLVPKKRGAERVHCQRLSPADEGGGLRHPLSHGLFRE